MSSHRGFVAVLLIAACGSSSSPPATIGDGGATVADAGMEAGPPRACLPIPPEPSGWQPATNAPFPPRVFTLPDDYTVYVLPFGESRLLRSDDQGAHWCYVPVPGAPLALFNTLSPRTMFVSIDWPGQPSNDGGPPPPPAPPGAGRIVRTDDGGDTWTAPLDLPFPPGWIWAVSDDARELIASGLNQDVVGPVVTIRADDLWSSHDGGRTWDVLRDGLSTEVMPAPRHWSFITPDRTGRTLVGMAATMDYRNGIGPLSIYVSHDGGRTWVFVPTPMGPAAGNEPANVAFDPTAGTLMALTADGAFFKRQLDTDWTAVGALYLRNPFVMSVLHDPLTIFIEGTDDAGRLVQKSLDGGLTWATVFRMEIPGTAFRLRSGAFLALDATGLRLSEDDGKTWRSQSVDSSGTTPLVSATRPGTRVLYSQSKVLVSSDAAGHWVGRSLPGDLAIDSLAFDPQSPDRQLAAMTMRLSPVSGFFQSTGGQPWQELPVVVGGKPVSTFTGLTSVPTVPPALFALTETGLVRSEDSGASWTPSFTTSGFVRLPWTWAPSDPKTMFISDGHISLQSSDGGRTWSDPVANPSADGLGMAQLLFDPMDPTRVYGLTKSTGVLQRTTDGGATWTRLGRIPQVTPMPGGFALSAHRPGTIFFLHPFTRAIGETSDDGVTVAWHEGLPAPPTAIYIDPQLPDLLFASTGVGMFQLSIAP